MVNFTKIKSQNNKILKILQFPTPAGAGTGFLPPNQVALRDFPTFSQFSFDPVAWSFPLFNVPHSRFIGMKSAFI